MSLLTHLGSEVIEITWRASLLIALIFALRPHLVRWLPSKALPWLWLVVAIKLLLISAPAGWWSLYNLTALGRHFSVVPTLPNVEPFAVMGTAGAEMPVSVPSLPPAGESWNWTTLLALAWLLGVVVLAVVQVVANIRFHRQLVREEKLTDSRWQSLLKECAGLVGVKTPTLIETQAIGSPAIIGLIRPRLLVPNGLLDHLKPEEARLVFIHELFHLRRCDLWLLTFFALARTVHWFNPLAWLAERALRADCEAACDADVLRLTSGISEPYARTLLRLIKLSSQGEVFVLVAPLSINPNQTQRRLEMIMHYRKSSRWTSLAALAMAATIGALALPNEVTAQDQSAPASPAQPATNPPDSNLNRELKGIVLSLDFNNATIEEATNFLVIESKRLDPDHQGVNFIIQPEASKSAKPLTLTLNKVSLGEALRYVCELANVKFIKENNVIFIVSSTQNVVDFTTNPTTQPASRSAQALARKLKSLIIDKVNFENLDIVTAIQFLQQKSKELDRPDHQGVNFVLRLTPEAAPPAHPIHRKVSMTLENVPLDELLGYIAEQTNLKWFIEDNAVYFRP